jgi:hypothetical protein
MGLDHLSPPDTRASAVRGAQSALDAEADEEVVKLLGADDVAVRHAATNLLLADFRRRENLLGRAAWSLPTGDAARLTRLRSWLAIVAHSRDASGAAEATMLLAKLDDIPSQEVLLEWARAADPSRCDFLLQGPSDLLADYNIFGGRTLLFTPSDSFYDKLLTALQLNPACGKQAGEAALRALNRRSQGEESKRSRRVYETGQVLCGTVDGTDRLGQVLRRLAESDPEGVIQVILRLPDCIKSRDVLLNLIANSTNWQPSVRAAAALALPTPVGAGSPQPKDALALELFARSSVEERRRIVFESVGTLSEARSMPFLFQAVTNTDPMIRAFACDRMASYAHNSSSILRRVTVPAPTASPR